MYNKEAFRKELEDAVNAGIRIKIDGYESHIIKDQLVQSYITTRLAAIDDGQEGKGQEELWDKFRSDIYYCGLINNNADSEEVTKLIDYWKTKYTIKPTPALPVADGDK